MKRHRLTQVGGNLSNVSFAESGHLNDHLHSTDGLLKSHLRIATCEKPFKCDLCGLCFSKSGNLNNHLRTHFGEKPFKCDICGLCFAQRGTLTTHLIPMNLTLCQVDSISQQSRGQFRFCNSIPIPVISISIPTPVQNP